jgi:hypothetical protein
MNILNTLTIGERKKIYLILAFTSLILFFLAVWQVRPVIVEPSAPLGLASYLPVTYWIGFTLIMITGVLAVLDQELKKDATFIIILIVLSLFISGIAVFIQENATEPDAYTHFPGVYDLLKTNHLNINVPQALESYNSWPVYHFLSAAMLAITNVGFTLVKYVPLVWLLFLILVTYSTGKRFHLAPNYCFLLSSLAVLSFWIGVNEYTPRLLGMILLLTIFMLILNHQNNIGENIILIILFSGLVMTHGTSSIVAIFAITLLSIYKRDPILIIFFIIIFAVWQIYESPLMFQEGILAVRKAVLDIFEVTKLENYQGAASTGRLAARYSQLSYLVIYAVSMMGIVFSLITKKIKDESRKHILALFFWIVGITANLLVGSGSEVDRTYIFLIVPLASIVCLAFTNWKILIPIMCIFSILFPLARYSTVASWGQVLTTELKGSEFWANRDINEAYFADNYSVPALIMHYNRKMLIYQYWTPNNIAKMGKKSDNVALDSVHYIIMSKQGNDGLILGMKDNPYIAWLQTENGEKSNLMYNNGFFQIYQNNVVN